MRRMENIVRGSALDWTIVRPSGLFDLPAPTDYHAGEVDPIGGFTARIDLAHYLLTLADDSATVGKTVVVSTTEHTPNRVADDPPRGGLEARRRPEPGRAHAIAQHRLPCQTKTCTTLPATLPRLIAATLRKDQP